MFLDGYEYISNIDNSYMVSKQMTEYYAQHFPKLSFCHMDARDLAYEDETFDVVVDKGCLDTILCGDLSFAGAKKMFNEINRVLTSRGYYIVVTYGQPKDNERDRSRYQPFPVFTERLKFFADKQFDWHVTSHMVAKPYVSAEENVSTEWKLQETRAEKLKDI